MDTLATRQMWGSKHAGGGGRYQGSCSISDHIKNEFCGHSCNIPKHGEMGEDQQDWSKPDTSLTSTAGP